MTAVNIPAIIPGKGEDRTRLIRVPVHVDDNPAVFDEVAKLLASYSERIGCDVERIAAQCHTAAHLKVAATAYLAEIGSNIPDPGIKAAVKGLAAVKFKLRGVQ